MKKFLNRITPKKAGFVVLDIFIFILIPYLYLIACGLIFDKWLHMYNMTVFIFFSLMFFWLISLILSVLLVISFVKSKTHPETFAANRAAYEAERAAKKEKKAAERAEKAALKAAVKAEKETLKAAGQTEKETLKEAARDAQDGPAEPAQDGDSAEETPDA